MKFSDTYPSPRALAIEHGLAVPGRGRLRREAKALVEEAIKAGVTFTDQASGPSKPFDPEEGPPRPVESEEVPEALRDGVHYARLPSAGNVREPLSFSGKTEEGFTVGWDRCHRCAQFSAHCECKEGVKPPVLVTHVTSKAWTND